MAIALTGVVARSPRRVRLVFSNTLAAGAFTTLSYYEITPSNDVGVSVEVLQALVVADSANNVELAVSQDLTPGVPYLVSAVGVPAIDLSVTPNPSELTFQLGEPLRQANVEPAASELDVLLYGRDIIWTGEDFLESPDGDLASIAGVANLQASVQRRMNGEGLYWDPSYGPNVRSYVDAPSPSAATLKLQLERNAMLDDRVALAKATYTQGSDRESHYYTVTIYPRGLNSKTASFDTEVSF